MNTRVNKVGDGFAKLSTKINHPETGEVMGHEELELPTYLAWRNGGRQMEKTALRSRTDAHGH